ncbi:MAG: LPXTG cell wall anchor domain-containing protein, partial [Erysipelotrichaceae bacterium]|nr:LPXTG cell wall anchor domain-containing protein [Erysipelotrichaceae bacterium]
HLKLTFQPEKGAVLSSVEKNGTSVFEQSVPETWTFAMPKEDTKLLVKYEKAPDSSAKKESQPSDLKANEAGKEQENSPAEPDDSSLETDTVPETEPAGSETDANAADEASKTDSKYQEAYDLAEKIYPGSVNDLLWDNVLYQKYVGSRLRGGSGRTAESYIGTEGKIFYTIDVVSNDNVPIKTIDVTRMLINGTEAYCINPMTWFKPGPKVRLNASTILNEKTIQECSLAEYYIKNSKEINGKTYGDFSTPGSDAQYMIIQCMVYRTLGRLQPGMNISQTHITQGPGFNWDQQVALLNDAYTFAKDNVDNFTGYGGYVFVTNSADDPSQPGVIFNAVKKIERGSLRLKKAGANQALTENNPLYSLNGAQFEVKNAEGASVGILTTDASGQSNTLSDLPAGTYTVTETKAPAGYAIEVVPVNVTVQTNQTAEAAVSDQPMYVPVNIVVSKLDASSQKPIEGVQFTLKYYALNSDTDPAADSQTPVRTWVLKSDADGAVKMDDAHKVSGDEFWLDENGNAILPLGTLTIQETQAADGYFKNDEVIVKNLKADGSAAALPVLAVSELSNRPVSLKVIKIQNGTVITLPDVEFTHTGPDGKTETAVTDQKGELTLTRLLTGTHTLEETGAPEGYAGLPEKVVFSVQSDGTISLEQGSLGVIEKDVLTLPNDAKDAELEILKENNLQEKLSGAEFSLYSDEACTDLIESGSTDEDGTVRFKHLKNQQTYYLKETKAPANHQMETDDKGQAKIWQITPNLIPVQNVYEFKVNGVTVTPDTPAENLKVQLDQDSKTAVLHLTVSNKMIESKLPNTGGTGMGWIVPAGLAAAAVSALLWYAEARKSRSAR